MFEKATRSRLRFETVRGCITVEDLWHLPLQSKDGFNLDDIAKKLYKEKSEKEITSFVNIESKTNEDINLRFDIVKHIIKVKLDEKESSENAAIRKAQKDKILAIIADKEDEALKGESLETLKKMVDDL